MSSAEQNIVESVLGAPQDAAITGFWSLVDYVAKTYPGASLILLGVLVGAVAIPVGRRYFNSKLGD